MVQCGCIGKGSVFPHWGVEILLVSVGTERRRIEGDQRRAAGLCVPDALYRRMYGGDLIFRTCYKALHSHRVRTAALPIPLPRLSDGGVLLRVDPGSAEHEISACRYFVELSGKGRVLHCVFRFPVVEKCQN